MDGCEGAREEQMHCPLLKITGSFEVSTGKIAVVTAATGEDIIDSSHSKAAGLQRRPGQWAVNPNRPPTK